MSACFVLIIQIENNIDFFINNLLQSDMIAEPWSLWLAVGYVN
jgi:hypothetical protein